MGKRRPTHIVSSALCGISKDFRNRSQSGETGVDVLDVWILIRTRARDRGELVIGWTIEILDHLLQLERTFSVLSTNLLQLRLRRHTEERVEGGALSLRGFESGDEIKNFVVLLAPSAGAVKAGKLGVRRPTVRATWTHAATQTRTAKRPRMVSSFMWFAGREEGMYGRAPRAVNCYRRIVPCQLWPGTTRRVGLKHRIAACVMSRAVDIFYFLDVC